MQVLAEEYRKRDEEILTSIKINRENGVQYRSIFFVGIILSCVLVSAVRAEIIYLKNGTTVEGKIITDEPSRIQVDIGGIPKTIYRGEIDRISGGAAAVETVIDLKDKPVKALKDIPESKK